MRPPAEEVRAINRFLLNLTSRRAVHIFLWAFVLGALSVWFNILVPWLPATLVLLYGCVLLYTAKVLLVSHSEMTNNSPYFLGFLLFLVSLFTSFTKLGTRLGELQVDFVVRQLGSALLTTIVGLPFRQLLFAYAPGQQEQDIFYRTLEEELRTSATQFKKSQTELVTMLQDFIATRGTLFSEEEKASKSYLSSLTRAIGIFDQAFDNYPRQISSALSACATALAGLRAKSVALSKSSEGLDETAFAQAVGKLEALKESTSETAKQLENLKASIGTLSKAADELPGHVQKVLLEAKKGSDETGLQLKEKVEAISKDLDAIDTILSEFIKVSQERIAALR